MGRLGHGALAVVALLVCTGPLLALAQGCDLSVTFQPAGVKNIPFGWTAAGQAALKEPNKDPSQVASIKLAALPVPTLYVAPLHPLLGATPSCASACVPAAAAARRLLAGAAAEPEAAQPSPEEASSALEDPVFPEDLAFVEDTETAPEDELALEDGSAPEEPAPEQPAPAGDAPLAEGPAPAPGDKGAAVAAPQEGAPAAAGPAPEPASEQTPVPAVPVSPEQLNLEAARARPAPATLTPEAAPQVPQVISAGPAPAAAAKCGEPSGAGSLVAAANWTLVWSLDGGKAVELGPFSGGAPVAIRLDSLAGALKGDHVLEVNVTLKADTASVTGSAATLPASDSTVTRKVSFSLVDAADAPDPNGGGSPGQQPGDAAGDKTADLVAMKYYCALNFNVGGKVKKNVTVERVPEDGPVSPGAFQCARHCNKMGTECVAFGVVAGSTCYLMSAVNSTAGGADSLVTAMCMKSMQDWMALGLSHGVAAARDKYYCLPTFDVQGWPAGQGPDAEEFGASTKPVVTSFALNTEPIICAGQCSQTPGCEFFVQASPSGCYLKGRPFDSDSPYGSTGPNKNVVVTCFRGEEQWMRAGSILDAALPQLPVTFSGGGVLTGAIAGGSAVTGNASALTYYCIREYGVNGTLYLNTTVGAGDIGTVACAAACDVAGVSCAVHMTDALGKCSLFSSYQLSTSAPDSLKYALCFKTVREWEAFGQPDRAGMYCLKKYDIAGDGLSTRDFVTSAGGAAGAIEYCKGQCQAMTSCEFTVAQGAKCYLKANIQGGTYGKTGASPSSDATCVKGADSWLKFALQVSNQPPAGTAAAGATADGRPMPPRRNVSSAQNRALSMRGGGTSSVAIAMAWAAAWLLACLLV